MYPSSSRPLHSQIATLLRGRIIGGYYPPGSRIGTEDTLTTQFGVSRTTVRQALADLGREGYIVSRRGLGTFVAEDRPQVLPRRGYQQVTFSGFLDDLFLLSGLISHEDVRTRLVAP